MSDLTGELMRYAITAIPRKGGRATANAVCKFVRQCKADFDTLTSYSRELAKKQRVTAESLHKIEDGGSRRRIGLINGLADTARGAVAYAVAIRCYEYVLPQDILDDIVSRTLDTSHPVESRGRQGDYVEFGYY